VDNSGAPCLITGANGHQERRALKRLAAKRRADCFHALRTVLEERYVPAPQHIPYEASNW